MRDADATMILSHHSVEMFCGIPVERLQLQPFADTGTGFGAASSCLRVARHWARTEHCVHCSSATTLAVATPRVLSLRSCYTTL